MIAKMPQVDVVVPSYNYARYLEGCVNSALTQDGVDVRVLILDDASKDSTPEVGERLAAADNRVTYRRHATNRGHIETYNEGLLHWARGEYLLLISADDLLAPGALRRAVSLLEEHPDAVLAHGRQTCFEDAPPVPGADDATDVPAYQVQRGSDFISATCSDGQNPVATPTAIVRTRAQHAVGGYDVRLPHTADLEIWLRLATCGDVIRVDAVQAFKRHHGRNMQLAFLTDPEGDIGERQKAFEIFLERYESAVHDAAGKRERAQAALANDLFWRASRLFDLGNREASNRLLDAAALMHPVIEGTPQWRRMVLKRRLGSRVWAVVQKLRGKQERQWA